MTPQEMFNLLLVAPREMNLKERAMQFLIDNFFLTDIDKDTLKAKLQEDKTALDAKITALS